MRCLKVILLLFLSLKLNLSYASVIMYGTRIIYPANKSEVTLTFSNEENRPYAVQVWSDIVDNGAIDEANAPFVITPPIFQILPKTKQNVRLIYSGQKQDLPSDRESLFYVSFSQIPALTKQELEQQQNSSNLTFIFRNTVKLFYRPNSIKGSNDFAGNPAAILQAASISKNEQNILIKNNTGFYAVIVKAELVHNGQKSNFNLKNNDLAPFGELNLNLTAHKFNAQAKLVLTCLNDYGAQVVFEHFLN